MNPIHQLMSLLCSCEKRKCPGCGAIQIVDKSKKDEIVVCEVCGKLIVPHELEAGG